MPTNFLQLPKLTISYEDRFAKKNFHVPEVLFVCGGRFPSEEWFSIVAESRRIWAIDRGVDLCYKMQIVPEILIGDLDSTSSEAIDWICTRNFPTEIHPRDKDLTDFQLAIKQYTTKFFSPIVVTGIFGGRLDMTLSNIFSCMYVKNFIVMSDENETVFFLHSGETVEIYLEERFDNISLIPLTERCLGVSINNVHWKLIDSILQRKNPSAVSNRLTKNFDPDKKNPVTVSISHGILAVYIGRKFFAD